MIGTLHNIFIYVLMYLDNLKFNVKELFLCLFDVYRMK